MPYCMLCGSQLIWQNDYDFADFDIDKIGIVGIYICSNPNTCGAIFEVQDLYYDDSEINSLDIYNNRSIKYHFSNID